MNLIKAFKAGQKGANMGLPMGQGLKKISATLNGVQRSRIYTVAAGPKAGKSTFVDLGFIIEPCLFVLQNNPILKAKIAVLEKEYFDYATPEDRKLEIEKQRDILNSQIVELDIIYNSYEIDRITKEFDFLAHFINRDYGILDIALPAGVFHKGINSVPLSSDYLMGQLKDDGENLIKVTPEILNLLPTVYQERIVPLFGEYDDNGNQISKGLITFLESKDNPTGIRNYLIRRAESRGTFRYSVSKDAAGVEHKRIIGYTPNNPNEFVLVVTDHLRKLIPERNFNLKQTVDKFSEYSVEFRNTCRYSFVQIIHLNRSMTDVSRMKYADDSLYPMSDDLKETGNLSEDSNYVLTLFNPNDDKYQLKKHFDKKIRDASNNILYPNMRTVHLVESRHCSYPQHFRVNMIGAVKQFEDLIIN